MYNVLVPFLAFFIGQCIVNSFLLTIYLSKKIDEDRKKIDEDKK